MSFSVDLLVCLLSLFCCLMENSEQENKQDFFFPLGFVFPLKAETTLRTNAVLASAAKA